MQGLLALIGITLAYPAARWIVPRSAMANHALEIATQGATGNMTDGQLNLDLPVSIANGSDHVIMRVTLWVKAYACPDADAPTLACTKLISTQQNLPMRLMPGASLETVEHISTGLPDQIAGRHLRILRSLDQVEDDTDETNRLAEERLNRRQ